MARKQSLGFLTVIEATVLSVSRIHTAAGSRHHLASQGDMLTPTRAKQLEMTRKHASHDSKMNMSAEQLTFLVNFLSLLENMRAEYMTMQIESPSTTSEMPFVHIAAVWYCRCEDEVSTST